MFNDNRPGKAWIRNFLQRHTSITLPRRVNLESDRAVAMSPENVASHYARVRAHFEKYEIDATRILNLYESVFSIRSMTLGRSKCLVKIGSRGNTTEPKFRATCDHVTIMTVISASGQIYTCLLYTSPSPRDQRGSRMPSSA